ncbi:GIY-YIG nuclease family protein [Patescibacteria group bacterium]
MWYIYILSCSDKKTYVGCKNNLMGRIKRHADGQVSATKNRLPVKLVAYFAINNKHKAYKFERYLKTGTGRLFLKKRIFT